MIITKQGTLKNFSDYEHLCLKCGTQVKADEKDLICEDLFLYYIICPTCHRHIWVPPSEVPDNIRQVLDSELLNRLEKKLKKEKAELAKRETQILLEPPKTSEAGIGIFFILLIVLILFLAIA